MVHRTPQFLFQIYPCSYVQPFRSPCPASKFWVRNRLEEDYSWAQYWNYLRRQLYVMDTYCSPLNQRINHTMMLLHSYLSVAFVLPAATGAAHISPPPPPLHPSPP